MSNKPFILITGDDSVRAEGLILVKRIVEKFADCQIIATKDQQSGTGTGLTLSGCEWGKETVNGDEAIWVDGLPGDSVFFAFEYLDRKPNLVISGMNTGENVGDEIHSSGTVGAAMLAAQEMRIPAIAFSQQSNIHKILKVHDGKIDEDLLKYPGEMIEKITKIALENKITPGTFWNVNFPTETTDKIKITETKAGVYWETSIKITENRFKYNLGIRKEYNKEGVDGGELNRGHVSITPCKIEFTDYEQIGQLREIFS